MSLNILCKLAVLTIVLTIASISSFSQIRELTFESYLEHYTQALTRSRKDAARHTERNTWFQAGRLTRQWISVDEKDDAGSSRYRIEKKAGKLVEIKESIEVDGVSYCRLGKTRWVEGECEGEGYSVVSNEGETVTKYTFEDSTSGGKVLKAVTKTNILAPNGKRSSTFTENTIYINSEGYIAKREYVSGILPRRVDFSVIETYEYGIPIPQIIAPKL